MVSNEEYLRERYGSTEGKNRLLWLGGAIAALIITIWLIWQAVAITKPQAHSSVIGSTVNSDTSITVRYNVTSSIGEKVRCTITAYNANTIEVGVTEVETEIVTQPATVNVDVPTTQRATRGDVQHCTVVK
ncbi:hypothetical protein BSZ39_07075 [Bowdeniella nasicola]|uniref:DUF4307 domain-containing protein n=1 Tax=Bowdeniella nasicola TaxID=208480 RepID=A0A1Q5Q2P9_9ACTO|nr:DUF4307 domain-containing protein [Bowdeniella nasicola]OKL53900.1 hypothetical protein BSZ39_07075 [Bowdeniella nasicola]